MSLCKCGQESTTTHACDLMPTPTVTAQPFATLSEQLHEAMAMSPASYAAVVTADLRASLTTALAERDVLQQQVSDAVKEYDELEAANNALTVERDEARRQLARAAQDVADLLSVSRDCSASLASVRSALLEAHQRIIGKPCVCVNCEDASQGPRTPSPPPEVDRG